jgi:hypothetical protein
MWGGQRARVRDVEEGGVVVLYYVDTAMIEVVPPNQRGQRIRRVVIDDP